VRVERDATTVVEGGGRAEAVRAHLAALDRVTADEAPGPASDRARQRAARLRGGVALIRVGGMTEIDLRERMSRVEDALAATRSALEEGVVTGGGVALLRAGAALDGLEPRDEGEAAGIAIVRRALEEPLRQIAANAGADGNVAVARVREGHGAFGYDALAGDYADLDARGVLDATRVVRCALENAASIATMVLTTDALVVDDPAAASDEAPEA